VKIKLNKDQVNFLKGITKDTEFEKAVNSFQEDKEFNLNDDLVDELRELCAQYEIDNAQAHKDMALNDEGKIAYDLVNLLYV